MNLLHIHLALTHIPVLGPIFGLVLLTVALLKKSAELMIVSLGVFIGIAVLSVPVYLSGEAAEEAIEHQPTTPEWLVEAHERAALLSVVAMGVLGAASVGGLIVVRWFPAVAKRWMIGVLALSVIVAALMARTANLGGQIGHPEIRSGASASHTDDDRD